MRMHAAKSAEIESGELAAALAGVATGQPTAEQVRVVSRVPGYNAQLRTTCVATRLEGGHADNALPQRAKATVNCRLLPGEEPEYIRSELQRIAGDKVRVTARANVRRSDPTDPESAVFSTIRRVSESMWPGVPVTPVMSTGATDGSRLRNAEIPAYGVSGLFVEYGENRMHGRDERLRVESFHEGAAFLDRLVRALANGE
jgi:acetylornithine deacetylase/succinyl-diaminopimelate desuccinylase-like protein